MEAALKSLVENLIQICPAACFILEQNPGGTVAVAAQNPEMQKLLSSGPRGIAPEDGALLLNLPEVAETMKGGKCIQWTQRFPSSRIRMTCRCVPLLPGLCGLWMLPFYDVENRVLLDSLPVGIARYQVDPGDVYLCVYRNRACMEIHGVTDLNAWGEDGADYEANNILEEDRPLAAACMERFNRGTEPVDFEYRIVRADGEITWVRGKLSWMIPHSLCQTIYRDVTREKQAQLEQEKTQTLLNEILSTTQEKIFWKDADRRFVGANRAFLEYFGISSAQLPGKSDGETGWYPEPAQHLQDETQVLREGVHITRLPGICLQNGKLRNTVTNESPLYEKGKIVGLVGSLEDITEEFRQRMEIGTLNQRLLQALEREEKTNQEKSELLRQISQGMGMPLQKLTEVCSPKADDSPAEDGRAFPEMWENTWRLLNMMNDALDLQKLDSGEMQLRPRVCEAGESARMVESVIRPLAECRGIRLVTDLRCDADGRCVYADTVRVQQMLINLLGNAVRYTPAGGTVCWSSYLSEDSAALINVVEDNGPGISQEVQERMYDVFTGERRLADGLGLGIVKRLVELMEGTIRCDSAPGQGTRFTVTVPRWIATADHIAEQ